MKKQKNSIKPIKIGIYRSSSIGDMVLATACLDMLSQSRITCDITWIGSEPTLALIKMAYPNVRNINLDHFRGFLGYMLLVKQCGDLDILFNFQKNLKSRLFSWLLRFLKGTKTASPSKKQTMRWVLLIKARFMLRKFLPMGEQAHPVFRQFFHFADFVRLTLARRFSFLEEALTRKSISFFPNLKALATNYKGTPLLPDELMSAPIIVVAPGAAHPTKQAPTELFAEVINRIGARAMTKNMDFSIVVIGSKAESETAKRLCQLIRHPRLCNMTGKLTLLDSALVIQQSEVVLANDSSLVHIAEALGKPVAALFGPTSEAFGFAPFLPTSKAFSMPLSCRPCSKHGKKSCRYNDQLCFRAIDPVGVSDFCFDLLNH